MLGNFSSSCTTVNFTRRAHLYGVVAAKTTNVIVPAIAAVLYSEQTQSLCAFLYLPVRGKNIINSKKKLLNL
jgi:hypothetical protein